METLPIKKASAMDAFGNEDKLLFHDIDPKSSDKNDLRLLIEGYVACHEFFTFEDLRSCVEGVYSESWVRIIIKDVEAHGEVTLLTEGSKRKRYKSNTFTPLEDLDVEVGMDLKSLEAQEDLEWTIRRGLSDRKSNGKLQIIKKF